MQFSAIIAEYNPFTNGHLYHIEQTKKIYGLPVVCIMSGNFVQRGEIALLDKYQRAKHAVQAGASIVIELPTVFALSPAPDFAFGAIKTLNSLGCIKYLCCGSESGDIEKLTTAAEKLLSAEKSTLFKKSRQLGRTYSENIIDSVDKSTSSLIKKPNNILAIEYIKAIIKTQSKIIPVTIKREDNFCSTDITKSIRPSASAVRKLVFDSNITEAKKHIPPFVIEDIKKVNPQRFETLKDSLLLGIKLTGTPELSKINEATEGLEYRLKDIASSSTSYKEFESKVYTKRYKDSKINRLVIKSSLGITDDITLLAKKIKPYVKVLAIDSSNKNYLKYFDKNKSSIIVTKKDYDKLNKSQKQIINKDLLASSLSSICHSTDSNTDFSIGTLMV